MESLEIHIFLNVDHIVKCAVGEILNVITDIRVNIVLCVLFWAVSYSTEK